MEKHTIETSEKPKQKNMPLFVLKIVGNVVFYLIIVFLLLFSIMNIRAGNRNDGFPNIFGKGFLSVQTNSMEGDREDSFSPGDLLIVSVFKEKNFDKLEVGQVVTFYDAAVNSGKGGLNSHRIVYIHRDSEGHIDSLAVQGDLSVKDYGWTYNPADQSVAAAKANQSLISSGNVQNLTAKDIKGVMTGIWRGTGKVMDNLQKYWLFIFVLPVLLFLIFEIFMVARNVMLLKNEKRNSEIENTQVDIEATKEELRAQILAELRAEQESQKSNENSIESPTEDIKEPVEESAVEEPIAAEPVEENATEEPVASEPVEESVAEEPVVTEPVEESVAEEPAATEPVEENAAEEPVAAEPVEESVAEESVAAEPVEEKVVEAPAESNEPVKKTTTRKAPAKKTTTSATPKKTTTKKASTTGSKSTTSKTTTKKASTTSTAKKTTTASKSTASKSTKTSSSKTGAKKTSTTTKKKTTTGAAKEKGE